MKMKVYVDHVPAHAQVYVHPGGVVVDYLDGPRVVHTNIHDRSDVEQIAAVRGIDEIEWVRAEEESDGEEPVEETEDLAVQAPEWDSLSVSELKAAAKAEGISGYSKMKKAELVAALEA